MASLGKTTVPEKAPAFGCLNQCFLLPIETSPLQTLSVTWDLKAHAGDWLISLHVQQTAREDLAGTAGSVATLG